MFCAVLSIKNWKQSKPFSLETRYLNVMLPVERFPTNRISACSGVPESAIGMDLRLHAPVLASSLADTLQPVVALAGTDQPGGIVHIGGKISLAAFTTLKA